MNDLLAECRRLHNARHHNTRHLVQEQSDFFCCCFFFPLFCFASLQLQWNSMRKKCHTMKSCHFHLEIICKTLALYSHTAALTVYLNWLANILKALHRLWLTDCLPAHIDAAQQNDLFNWTERIGCSYSERISHPLENTTNAMESGECDNCLSLPKSSWGQQRFGVYRSGKHGAHSGGNSRQ